MKTLVFIFALLFSSSAHAQILDEENESIFPAPSSFEKPNKVKSSFILPSFSGKLKFNRKPIYAFLYSQKIYNQNSVSSVALISEFMIQNYAFRVRKLSQYGAVEREHFHILFRP